MLMNVYDLIFTVNYVEAVLTAADLEYAFTKNDIFCVSFIYTSQVHTFINSIA